MGTDRPPVRTLHLLRWSLLLAVCLLFVAACGGGGPAGGPPPEGGGGTSPPGGGGGGTSPPSGSTDPFKGTGSPPGGVPDGLFKSTPGGRCQQTFRPGETVPPFTVEIGGAELVCFADFNPDQGTAVVTISSPSGSRDVEISTFQGSGTLSVAPVPGDPRGGHTFSVTQPNMAQITGAFTVAAATMPRVVSLTRAGDAGTTFRIGLAGFPGEVALYLYKTQQTERQWRFLATLPTVRVGSKGETVFELKSQAGDPAAQYGITTDPPAQCNITQSPTPPCATFQITG